jgi:hypothetical protein
MAMERRQQIAATLALLLGSATLVVALHVVLVQFPRGLIILGCIAVGLVVGMGCFGEDLFDSPVWRWHWPRSPSRSYSR